MIVESEFVLKSDFLLFEEVVDELLFFDSDINELEGGDLGEVDNDGSLVDFGVDDNLVEVVAGKNMSDLVEDVDEGIIEIGVEVLDGEGDGSAAVLGGLPVAEEGEESFVDDGGLLELSSGGAVENLVGEVAVEVGFEKVDGDEGGDSGEGDEDEADVGGVVDGEFLDGDSHEEADGLEEDAELEDFGLNGIDEFEVDDEDWDDGGGE